MKNCSIIYPIKLLLPTTLNMLIVVVAIFFEVNWPFFHSYLISMFRGHDPRQGQRDDVGDQRDADRVHEDFLQ